MFDDELDNDDGDQSMNEIISDLEEEQSIIDQNELIESNQEVENEFEEKSDLERDNDSSKSSNQEVENEFEEKSEPEKDSDSSKSSDQEVENELGDSSDQQDEMGEESDEENKYLEELYLNRDLYEKTRDYDCDSLIDGDDYLNSSTYSETSEEDEMIENERINANLTTDTLNIYENAGITVAEFRLSLLLLQQKINLSPKNAKLVFEFVKALLPKENNLTSYSKLIGDFRCEKTRSTKACLICCKPLLPNEVCESRNCVGKKSTKSLKKYKDPLCVTFDFRKHLEYIVNDKWENILSYQGKYPSKNTVLKNIKIKIYLLVYRRASK